MWEDILEALITKEAPDEKVLRILQDDEGNDVGFARIILAGLDIPLVEHIDGDEFDELVDTENYNRVEIMPENTHYEEIGFV